MHRSLGAQQKGARWAFSAPLPPLQGVCTERSAPEK